MQQPAAVTIVLTDEALIYERREVPADFADEAIRQLNLEVPNFAGETRPRWRRGIAYQPAIDRVCRVCGAKAVGRCWACA